MIKNNSSEILAVLIMLAVFISIPGCDMLSENEFTLGGEVVREDERSMAGVEILVGEEVVKTDEDGNWQITGINSRVDVEVVNEKDNFDPPYYRDQGSSNTELDFTYILEDEDFYTIEGSIKNPMDEGIEDVEITLEDQEGNTVEEQKSDEDGNYIFLDLYDEVDVVPEKEGWYFQPEKHENIREDSQLEFVGYEEVLNLAGSIEDEDGDAMEDVEIEFQKETGEAIEMTDTDDQGEFSLEIDMVEEDILKQPVIIEPDPDDKEEDWEFNPDIKEREVSDQDITFEGKHDVEYYDFEGKVIDAADKGIEDVEIKIEYSEESFYAYTDEKGQFTGSDVYGDVTVKIDPDERLDDEWQFIPDTKEIEQERRFEFVGLEKELTFQGRIYDEETGQGLDEVEIQVKNEQNEDIKDPVTTDADGNYNIRINVDNKDEDKLDIGEEVKIAPEKTNWGFSPPEKRLETSTDSVDFKAFDETYDVAGRITDFEGNSNRVFEIKVENGDYEATVTTNDEGEYEVTGLEVGEKYTLTPVKDGYDFQPDEITVDGSRDDADFEAYEYVVEGTIEDEEGEPVSGVTLTFAGNDMEDDKETTTNSAGEYSRSGLAGEVEIEPEKEGYDFQPEEITVDGPRDDADFEAIEDTYTVEGTVTDAEDDAITGVEIEVEDEDENEEMTVTTNDEGEYEVTGLDVDKEYTLTPEKDGYDFQPDEITVDGSRDDADFEAYEYVVEGTVIDLEGNEIVGAEIIDKEEDETLASTNVDGEYTITGLEADEKYTLEAEKDGYVFQPEEITVDGPRDDADFEAYEYVVEGTVTDAEGDAITGVEITKDGDEDEVLATTNEDGEYKVTGLDPEGDGYTLTPEKDGYEFQPDEITVEEPRDDADFEAYEYVVEGMVLDEDGDGIFAAEIKVKHENDDVVMEAYTDEEGEYKVTGLDVGEEYTLEAEKEGYDFQPEDIDVDGPRDDANFEGDENQ